MANTTSSWLARGDHERLFSFVGNVTTLAAAWKVNHDEAAARRAGECCARVVHHSGHAYES